MIKPVRELCDSKILTIFFVSINLFNIDTLFCGSVANS